MRAGRRLPDVVDHRRFLDAALPHIDVLHNVARRLTDDRGAAEDLVQETYLRAFAGFDGHRGGDMRSWLVAICLNTARSNWRRARRRVAEVYEAEVDAGAARYPSTDRDPADAAVAALDQAAVTGALAELPEHYRTAIVLVDLGGLTAQEAAAALGCPRGTVLARVHRGRRRLAEVLEREGIRRGP